MARIAAGTENKGPLRMGIDHTGLVTVCFATGNVVTQPLYVGPSGLITRKRTEAGGVLPCHQLLDLLCLAE